MKTVHSLPRIRRRVFLCLAGCTVAGLIGAGTLIPSDQSRAIQQSEYLVENQILSVDGLFDVWSDIAFGGLPPLPDTQPYDHPVGLSAVDWYAGGFSKEFLSSLVGTWEGDVPVYRLRVFQDQQTREIVIENADGIEIYSEPCSFEEPFCSAFSYALHLNPELNLKSKMAQAQFVAHNDPARYGITIDLVPVDRAFDLLYARAQNQSLLQTLAAQSLMAPLNPGGGGGAMPVPPQAGMMSMSGGSGESQITAINLLTNGIQIEMTSSFSSVTAFDLFPVTICLLMIGL